MRRFLTLVCLLGLALPAGISISGCVRNPAGNYCNGLGYGPKDTDIASIILQPQIAGISLAYGQTTQVQSPSAYTCKGRLRPRLGTNQLNYGTTNNQLVDISPGGNLCAGTWNRNTGGGIADYTYCYYPNPLPSTKGLPYAIAYITATADSVTSNPVAVYIHAPVTASVWSPPRFPALRRSNASRRTSRPSSTPRPATSQTAAAHYAVRVLRSAYRDRGKLCLRGWPGAGRHFGSQLRILHRHSQFLGQQLQRRHHCSRNHTNPRHHHRAAARHHLHHRNHCAIGIVGWLLLHLPAGIHQSLAGQRIHQGRRHAGRLAKPHHHRPRHAGQSHHRLEPLSTSPPTPLTSTATGAGTITAAFPGVAIDLCGLRAVQLQSRPHQ